MKEPVKYGLEGDGSLESIRQYAEEHHIDLSKPSEKKIIIAFALPKKKKKKKRVAGGRRGVNPINPNGYKYGYIRICRG